MRSPFLALTLLATLAGTTVAGDRLPERASPAANHVVAGTIAGVPSGVGVTVTLSGDATTTVVAGPDGSYAFAGIPDGTYRVTPSLPGHGFLPASRTVRVGGAAVTDGDFTATAAPRLAAVAPVEGSPGTIVTISGERFGAWRTGSSVLIGLLPMEVVSWSDDLIVARVPRRASPGALRVVAGGAASGPLPFAVPSRVLASSRGP
jgi:hypothetical protein